MTYYWPLYPFVDGSEKYTRGSVEGDARVQVPPITVLSAVQWVSKCENPAGWGQSSAAYSQKCSPAADRAHGGERDDETEMIADSYIRVCFFLIIWMSLSLIVEWWVVSSEKVTHRGHPVRGHTGPGAQGVRNATDRVRTESCCQWASR